VRLSFQPLTFPELQGFIFSNEMACGFEEGNGLIGHCTAEKSPLNSLVSGRKSAMLIVIKCSNSSRLNRRVQRFTG